MFNPGKEQDIRLADGRFARLGKLRLGVLRAFRDWVAEQVGDPFEKVERWIDRIPPEETVAQLKEAEDVRDQLRFFSLGTPLAARLLATEEGLTKLIHLLMLQRSPKATEDEAFEAVIAINEKAMAEAVISRAQGTEGGAKNSPAARLSPASEDSGPESAGETSTGD